MLQQLLQDIKDSAVAARQAAAARVRLAARRGQRALTGIAIAAVGGAFALMAVLGLLVAAAIALAPLVGAALAITAASLGAALLAAVLAFVSLRMTRSPGPRDSIEDIEHQKRRADLHLKQALPCSGDRSHPHQEAESERDSPAEKVIAAARKNPAIAASAAFAVLSLLGPRRTFTTIRRGMAVAATLASVGGALKKLDDQQAENADDDRPAGY